MENLHHLIKNCTQCKEFLSNGCNPVFSFSNQSKIVIIGQAPGKKVHLSGIPWADQSGKTLQKWMGISQEAFYDSANFAIVPMGFCYPGSSKSGDLPPRHECAPLWHNKIFDLLTDAQLILLIGQYAQVYYLPKFKNENLTFRVQNFSKFLPQYFPLPHPSPRNNIWVRKNPWFANTVLPILKSKVSEIINP